MQYIIHVAPTNLRESEQQGEVTKPCWIIRDYNNPEHEVNVFDVGVIGGVVTTTDLKHPLPNTGGHGWCYLITQPGADVSIRLEKDSGMVDADVVFRRTFPRAIDLDGNTYQPRYDQFVVSKN